MKQEEQEEESKPFVTQEVKTTLYNISYRVVTKPVASSSRLIDLTQETIGRHQRR